MTAAVVLRAPAPSAAPHRPARALVAAAVAAAVGTVAHLAGGGAVSAGGVAVGLAMLLGPTWLLAGRERGWAVLAAGQLGGQNVVHAVLASGTPPGHHDAVAADVMLCAHLLAAVAAAAWLRMGERRVWRAARRVARVVVAWWRTVRQPPSGSREDLAVAVAPGVAGPVEPTALRHAVFRRGPPVS